MRTTLILQACLGCFPNMRTTLITAFRGCFPNMRTTLILQALPGCFPNYKDDARTILIPTPFKKQGRAFRVAVKTGRSPPVAGGGLLAGTTAACQSAVLLAVWHKSYLLASSAATATGNLKAAQAALQPLSAQLCHCCSSPLLLHGGSASASSTQGRGGAERSERGY